MSTTPAGTAPAAPASTDPAAPTTGDPSQPQPAQPAAPAAPAAPAPPAPAAPATDADQLGEAGKRALQAERDRADAAEAKAKQQDKELEKLRGAQLTEQEKLEQRATQGDQRLGEGTEKLRRANLITALADKGLTGGKAKAAAKLVSVEFDDSDEPKDLDKAIDAAKAEYGEELFQGATPGSSGDPADPANPGDGTQPQTPDLHQGPRTPATEQEEDAAISQIMSGYAHQEGGKSPISILED